MEVSIFKACSGDRSQEAIRTFTDTDIEAILVLGGEERSGEIL